MSVRSTLDLVLQDISVETSAGVSQYAAKSTIIFLQSSWEFMPIDGRITFISPYLFCRASFVRFAELLLLAYAEDPRT